MDREDRQLVNFLRAYKPLAPEPKEDCEAHLLYLISQNSPLSPRLRGWLGLIALVIAGAAGVWLMPRLQPQLAERLTEQERQEIVSQLLYDLSLPELADNASLWLDAPMEL